MKLSQYAKLATEQEKPRCTRLDALTPEAFVRLVNREDRQVLRAIAGAQRDIAGAIATIAAALRAGGRLFFMGAGTSGRLGIIEAAECPPTFGTPPSLVQAIMAGGRSAVFRSKEGSEDSEADGEAQVRRRLRPADVLVGIAASGVTPFVRAGLQAARAIGAKTVLLTCHADPSQKRVAERVVALKTGPEILTGSTRLKAGTACKMALNLMTTGSMVQVGKVYGHWMVDLQPKSRKLVARGQRLIQRLGNVSEREAARLFAAADRQVKVAIVMARRGLDAAGARRRLDAANGFLRKAL